MIQVFWVNAGSVLIFFKDFFFFVLGFVDFILLTIILLFFKSKTRRLWYFGASHFKLGGLKCEVVEPLHELMLFCVQGVFFFARTSANSINNS